jgi:hypothetical protein
MHRGMHAVRISGIRDTYDPLNHAVPGLAARPLKAHTGFEPVSQEVHLPEPLRRKLTELRLQSDVRSRRGSQ